MRVFIANFGQSNYLWPECQKHGTVATIDNVGVRPFWENGDQVGFTNYAMAHMKTARMETPTRPVASRWFGINDAIADTSGDAWIHREKAELWWTVSRPDSVQLALVPSFNPARDGPMVYELHKPADPLQQLSPDNTEYALALKAGDPLDAWHDEAIWRAKVERTRKNPAISYDARKKAIYRMVDIAFNTVVNSNGQQVLRTVKGKEHQLPCAGDGEICLGADRRPGWPMRDHRYTPPVRR